MAKFKKGDRIRVLSIEELKRKYPNAITQYKGGQDFYYQDLNVPTNMHKHFGELVEVLEVMKKRSPDSMQKYKLVDNSWVFAEDMLEYTSTTISLQHRDNGDNVLVIYRRGKIAIKATEILKLPPKESTIVVYDYVLEDKHSSNIPATLSSTLLNKGVQLLTPFVKKNLVFGVFNTSEEEIIINKNDIIAWIYVNV